MQLSVLSQPALSFAPRYPCALFLQPPSVLKGPDGVRLSKELSQPQPPISLPQGSQWPGEGGGGGGERWSPIALQLPRVQELGSAHLDSGAQARGLPRLFPNPSTRTPGSGLCEAVRGAGGARILLPPAAPGSGRGFTVFSGVEVAAGPGRLLPSLPASRCR